MKKEQRPQNLSTRREFLIGTAGLALTTVLPACSQTAKTVQIQPTAPEISSIIDRELRVWSYWVPRGWSKTGPIKTQSRIDTPDNGERVAAGRQVAVEHHADISHQQPAGRLDFQAIIVDFQQAVLLHDLQLRSHLSKNTPAKEGVPVTLTLELKARGATGEQLLPADGAQLEQPKRATSISRSSRRRFTRRSRTSNRPSASVQTWNSTRAKRDARPRWMSR